MAAAYQHHFYGHIEEEVKRFLAMLLVDPSRYHDLVRELTGRVMSRLAWDDATQGPENGQSALKTLRQMSVSGPIVNTMTPIWDVAEFFRYNPWRKFEMERERNQKAWWQQLFRVARTRFLRGDLPKDTWTYRYFEQLQSKGNTTLEMSPKEEEFASCMLGFQCLVGVVTVSGPLQFFLMAMQLHPEWQKKAQAEIDRVCGDRIPDMRDWPNLPTVRACLKETLRWRSGVPLGKLSSYVRWKVSGAWASMLTELVSPEQACRTSASRTMSSAASRSRRVPSSWLASGKIILANPSHSTAPELTDLSRQSRAINRVESKYPDPENYRPERWLEEGWPTYMEPLTRYPNFREGHGMHTFGWGRRQCLGQLIVDDEMFLAGAGVLWAFDLLPKRCPCTGKVVEFDSKATNAAVILEPLPFPMEIKPRSKKREQQILENYSAVRDVLKV